MHLMVASAGVFALVSGFVSASQHVLKCKVALMGALALFAISILLGYLSMGIIASQVFVGTYDIFYPNLVNMGFSQMISFLFGGFLLMIFIFGNVKR